jgi:hypothetical protein
MGGRLCRIHKFMKASFKHIILNLFILLLFTDFSFADAVFLKNGRKITANKIWRENDKVICAINGNTVSVKEEDVLKIEFDENPRGGKNHGFRFDVWQSAMDIEEILLTARSHDIPLVKEGLVSIIKNFNPDLSSKYAATATQYYYKTQLLGHPAAVNLFLTPTSKKLHSLSVRWEVFGDSRRKDLEQDLKDMITSKYGRPKGNRIPIFGKITFWRPSQQIEIEYKEMVSGLTLTYKDNLMIQLQETESQKINNEKKTEYRTKDRNKF